MIEKCDKIKERVNEISALLCDASVLQDTKKAKQLGKELKNLEPIATLYDEYLKLEQNVLEAEELLKVETDESMKAYFEKLGTETSWFKLFIPIFIGMAILLEVGTPVIMYIVQVLIKHHEYDGVSFGYGLCVALIYSAILAGVISSNHRNNEQDKSNEAKSGEKE